MMINRRFCLAIAAGAATLALSACATIPAGPNTTLPPGSESGTYFAMGTEPGWTAEITPTQINYAGNYGETQIRVPVSVSRKTQNGMHYSGRVDGKTVSVDIAYAECNDGMSDRTFAHRVSVTANGATYKGCGGGILPPVNLNGTRWNITQINDAVLSEELARAASVQFADGRMALTVGCNRMMMNYKVSNHQLSAADPAAGSPLISTRMGCAPPLDGYERDIAALFAEPVHLRYTPKGGIEMMGKGASRLILQRAI